MTTTRTLAGVLATVAVLAACGGGQMAPAGSQAPGRDAEAVTAGKPPGAVDLPPQAQPGELHSPATAVSYRVEVRTDDEATADFGAVVHEVLTDPRGWVRAGFHFREDASAAHVVVLAEGAEVDRLCHPYDTRSTYSCQNGEIVALNADRWRSATPQWPADLAAYRTMLVNHEVGHLLHLHHPEPQCPGLGLPAPVMAQQSTSLDGCLPHPWPLQWEVELAAERREPLAPPADHDPSDHRPVPPASRS